MNNEQYLVVSYFSVGSACVGLALATYSLLRRSLQSLTSVVRTGRLGRVGRRLFMLGLVFPSLCGFFSVAYTECTDYKHVIADRSILIARNFEQLSRSLDWIAGALLFWASAVTVAFLVSARRNTPGG